MGTSPVALRQATEALAPPTIVRQPARRRSHPRWHRAAALPSVHLALVIVLVVAFWHMATASGAVPAYMLPRPLAVAAAFERYHDVLIRDALVTGKAAAFGLALAVVAAFVVATAIVHSPVVRNSVMPIIVGLEAIPKIAFAPFLILWIGIGMPSRVALAGAIAFFPLVVNVSRGLADIDGYLLGASRVWGGSWWKILVYLRLPNAVIPFLDALRVALPGSMIGAILGEFVASNEGLGHDLLLATSQLQLDFAFALLVTIAAISVVGFRSISLLERVLVGWKRP